jgi:hypothetical protein
MSVKKSENTNKKQQLKGIFLASFISATTAFLIYFLNQFGLR